MATSQSANRPASPAISRLVAAWAAQRKGFEWGQAAVRPRDVVIGDLDGGETAGSRSRIKLETGEAIRMRRVAHSRPGRFLFDVNRGSLACRRVRCADGGNAPARRGVEKQLV